MSLEGLLACDQLLDLDRGSTQATRIDEAQAVVGEHGMEFVRSSGNQIWPELPRYGRGDVLAYLDESAL